MKNAPSFLWPDYDLKTPQGQNEFLLELSQNKEMQEEMEALQSEGNEIRYPFASDDPNALFIGPIFGRVEMENENITWQKGYKSGVMARAEAMTMAYFINQTASTAGARNNWTEQMIEYLDRRVNNNESFNLFYLTVHSGQIRMTAVTSEFLRLVPFLMVCIICLMAFTGFTTLRGFPAHRTMPWIGPIGVLTSVLGVGSAFGLLGWVGYKMTELCFAIPVLILAVGIDDVFVYSENYRETNPAKSVRTRVALMMRHASPGIVVTSFMNSLAFIIDTSSPFYVLQVFSNVSVVAAVFDFVYQMTFFPACLAALATFERDNKHGCFCCCVTVKPRRMDDYENEDTCTLICQTAPAETIYVSQNLPVESQRILKAQNRKERKEGKNFFRDTYTPYLLSKKVSLFALIIYVAYLILCGYLATQIKVGMVPKYGMPERSNGQPNNLALYFEYFRDFSYQFKAIIDEPGFEYWLPEKQMVVEGIFNDILKMPNVGTEILSQNWLRSFTNYATENQFNISTEGQFLYYLRERYFKQKTFPENFIKDVRFANWTDEQNLVYLETDGEPWLFPRIVSSSLVFWAVEMVDFDDGIPLLDELKILRHRVENSINIKFHSAEFAGIETNLSTVYVVVYNTLIQLGAVLVVTALMMPVSCLNNFFSIKVFHPIDPQILTLNEMFLNFQHPVALFWISIMLCSITLGVITITCSWGVTFDQISVRL